MRVGVWLVRDDDGWIMIDAGTPWFARVIHDATIARTGGEIPKCLILTHGHVDHAGSVHFLQDRWAIPVLAHAAEREFVEGIASYDSVRPAWWGHRLIQPIFSVVNRLAPGARVTGTIADGDTVGGLLVRHVPGHAPGMIALIHQTDRAIIVGDTFISRAGHLHLPIKFFTPDPVAATAAMDTLLREHFDHVLPSHGRPILYSGRLEAERAATRARKRHR